MPGHARQLSRQVSLSPFVSKKIVSDSLLKCFSRKIHHNNFQLLDTKARRISEDDFFCRQVSDVKSWWNSPRYKAIKRPYSAEDVVTKRGSLEQEFPSSLMARKLFNLLSVRAQEGKPVHTSAPS